jgi:hypothetical protein
MYCDLVFPHVYIVFLQSFLVSTFCVFFCRFIFDVSMIWSLSSCSGTKKCLSLFILASYLVE